MTKRKATAAPPAVLKGEVIEHGRAPAGVEAFSFGDPEPAVGGRGFLDYIQCWSNGRWYDPPVSLAGLSQAFKASPHHSSALLIKRNLLVSSLQPTRWLDRKTFGGLALDFLVLANAYPQRLDNRFGQPVRLERSIARFTRRGLKPGQFFFLASETTGLQSDFEFDTGALTQVSEPDIDQEIYGVPGYLSALQATLLNEAATIFRRRYYLNGSHAGFILYMGGTAFDSGDVDKIREALKNAKGPGNFRNLFLHAPAGGENAVKIIPVSEVAAKDEFLGIKNTTRDDILAAHRVPPQLLGIIPGNTGGFGNPTEAAAVFFEHEIKPLQRAFLEINDWLGEEAVVFGDYQPSALTPSTGAKPAA